VDGLFFVMGNNGFGSGGGTGRDGYSTKISFALVITLFNNIKIR